LHKKKPFDEGARNQVHSSIARLKRSSYNSNMVPASRRSTTGTLRAFVESSKPVGHSRMPFRLRET
jgi:hypothetical protein